MRKIIMIAMMLLVMVVTAVAKPDVKPVEIYEYNNGVTLVTTAFFNSSEDAYDYVESIHLRTIGNAKKTKSAMPLTSAASRHTYKASYEEITHFGNGKYVVYKRLYIYCGDHIKEYKVTEDEDYILQKAKLEGRF